MCMSRVCRVPPWVTTRMFLFRGLEERERISSSQKLEVLAKTSSKLSAPSAGV